MFWTRRVLLSLPFAVAAVLTVLVTFADRLHLNLERVAGYGLLFATPWAWLLNRGWFSGFHPLIVVLWIPALLYSGCVWLFFRGLRILTGTRSRQS
jgi:hypothetical protein